MPQLDPTWFTSQLFWLALTFVGLYIVLSRMVLPPLMDVIARREQAIRDDVAAAGRLKADAEHARADYEKTLAEARMKAQALISDALADQKAKGEQKAKELDRQIEQKLAASAQQIAVKKAQMIAELNPTSTQLAEMIVDKLTQEAAGSDSMAMAAASKRR
ncbi:MAG: F0F1 ATP synthase subunit B' [Proteobacteria bacterium]|nr:F0F1 ATP synthase subunit B' [Pseudomonadota bacterium]